MSSKPALSLFNLKGKIALVTGSSRGIGRAIAINLASQGAKIVIHSNHTQELGKEVVGMIKKLGQDAIYIQADISKKKQCVQLVAKTIAHFGRIDVLVNNAGIAKSSPFLEMSQKNWNLVLSTNLNSLFYITQPVLNQMVKQKSGLIIFISSIGTRGNPWQTNYAASRGGAESFMKSIAAEFGSLGIRANAISCGAVNTDANKNMKPERRKQLLDQTPIGRFLEPEEIANVALFLASDMSSPITGTVIFADGGITRK